MKTIAEIRRGNLDRLINEMGGLKLFCEKMDKSSSQVSQWKNGSKDSKTGKRRGMNDDTAALIEDACGKPRGWMDNIHDPATDVPDAWPFKRVTPFQFRSLSNDQQTLVELKAEDFLKDNERIKSTISANSA